MVTFLSGGTGTPKLLDGAAAAFSPEETTVVANTGDDIELGGLFVSPDVDTLLFQGGGILDRETWWGIDGDTHRTNSALSDIASAAGLPDGPQYLPEEKQTASRDLANWRRFSGVAEFMTIGDRDRAVHITRTSLLDEGHTLSEATERLASAFGLTIDLLPMSDDAVASLIHTDEGLMHFQEYWVAHRGEPAVDTVEFRGSSQAEPAPGVLEALEDDVIIGPSNPVTSIGPMLALPGVADALAQTTVVAVSPFLGDDAFSGPAADLMAAVNAEPNTAGLAAAYPFADAFVIDENDNTEFDRPTVKTDITIDSREDAKRLIRAINHAIENLP
ncbi:2-phospho-L-lactate transferase [Natrinema versiforme]|uniref:2-phospho-L-lactate transferase n=1 Tax=Natrinema versiforme JCM 10478 TaxID=1227496 RepID=L9XTR1_9EURY|nr:2-phospho-L-lactate transferase [Natrinema versiforme]ELY63988.1 LPPG:FO 2-phospho-L-lactate transferase [Natrinema versiforme JCM 10478]